MSVFSNPALLLSAASAVFVLHEVVHIFIMSRKQGAKPFSQAQTRFAWRCTVVALPLIGAWVYLAWTLPLTLWNASALTACLIACVVAGYWYERRLFALADAN